MSASVARACLHRLGNGFIAILAASHVYGQPLESSQTSPIDSPMTIVTIDDSPFSVRNGLRWERIGDAPLVQWPIAATWDDRGNLVVAESAGVRQSVEQQLQSRPHRIVRLMDTNGDGVLDKRQLVASDLSFPEGVMCVGNDIYVTAPPQIWRLIDADGDGVCEAREVWHDGKTLTFCANDLHGPFRGIDGWVYWSKSAFAQQTIQDLSGVDQTSSASHLYRRPLHQSRIDRVMTGGMDNLVDVAFAPTGESFFCSTFLHHPANGLRDGLGYGVYGSVFGKSHAVLDGHWRTGPLIQPIAELGPAAPSGLLCPTEATSWLSQSMPNPSQADSMLVCAQFNLQRVSAHRLQRIGAGYQTEDVDLVVGGNIDFHPVDVLEDRDGSLIVLDTGGWYNLCCPSSGKEERIAKGGIYRLSPIDRKSSYAEVAAAIDSRSRTVDPFVRLIDSNAWVRSASEREIIAMPTSARDPSLKKLEALMRNNSLSDAQRLASFWCAAKLIAQSPIPTPADRSPEWIRLSLASDAQAIRLGALHLVSLYRWKDLARPIERLAAQAAGPAIDRACAEALGRIGSHQSVESLMELYVRAHPLEIPSKDTGPVDRMLEHSLLYALMEIGDVEQLRSYLNGTHEIAKLAAIRALDQLRQLSLDDRKTIAELLEHPNSQLRACAANALIDHSDTIPQVLRVMAKAIDRADEVAIQAILPILVRWKGTDQVIEFIASQMQWASKQGRPSAWILTMIDAYRAQPLPEIMAGPLEAWLSAPLTSASSELLERLVHVQLLGEHARLHRPLLRIAADVGTEPQWRACAMASLSALKDPLGSALEQSLIEWFLESEHPAHAHAKRAIERLVLSEQATVRVFEHLDQLTPLDLPSAIECIGHGNYPKLDLQLIEQLPNIKGARSLSLDTTVGYFANRERSYQDRLRSQLSAMQEPPADIARALEQLSSSLPSGDARRGQDLFRTPRAACSACHRVGYVGGNVGPEMTRIGQTRTPMDMLESILYPSQRIAQGFGGTRILTTDGQIYNGLVLSESADALELIVGADKRATVLKTDIERREPSSVSVMPGGLDQTLSLQELSDLLAFLESCK